jgi:hypothetical protein
MRIKIIVLAFMLIPAFGKSQTKNEILMYAAQFVSGCADGVNQSLVHHYLGMGTRFWDFQTSWKNKYKDYDAGDLRPAFLGSKSIFVGFTDGYHLTRTVDRSFTSVSLALALKEKYSFRQIVKKVIISSLINRAGFLLFFSVIFPRRGGGLNK